MFNEGLYILIVVLVFAVLYVNHQFLFLGAGAESVLFHVELVLLLGYVVYRITRS